MTAWWRSSAAARVLPRVRGRADGRPARAHDHGAARKAVRHPAGEFAHSHAYHAPRHPIPHTRLSPFPCVATTPQIEGNPDAVFMHAGGALVPARRGAAGARSMRDPAYSLHRCRRRRPRPSAAKPHRSRRPMHPRPPSHSLTPPPTLPPSLLAPSASTPNGPPRSPSSQVASSRAPRTSSGRPTSRRASPRRTRPSAPSARLFWGHWLARIGHRRRARLLVRRRQRLDAASDPDAGGRGRIARGRHGEAEEVLRELRLAAAPERVQQSASSTPTSSPPRPPAPSTPTS